MKIEGHWGIGKAQNNNECPQRGKTGDPANFICQEAVPETIIRLNSVYSRVTFLRVPVASR